MEETRVVGDDRRLGRDLAGMCPAMAGKDLDNVKARGQLGLEARRWAASRAS